MGWNRSKFTFFSCPIKSTILSVISLPGLFLPLASIGSQFSGILQILMVVSSLAVANMESSKGLHSKSKMEPWCPCKVGVAPGTKRPGRSCRPTYTSPPPPKRATLKYLADALTYCWSPVTVLRRKPVWQNFREAGWGVGNREGRMIISVKRKDC